MALTDATVKTAKPKEKDYKLGDAGGLYLLVRKAGGKLWRMKYRYDGKEKLLSFGAYPAISLLKARKLRDDAREVLADNRDPNESQKTDKAENEINKQNTFEFWLNVGYYIGKTTKALFIWPVRSAD